LAALLYCYAIGFVNSTLGNSPLTKSSGGEKGTYFSVVSVNLFCHTTQAENSLNSVTKIPTKILEEAFYKISIIKEKTEQIFDNTITQYRYATFNLLVRYRKFNLIFPFHYFW